MSNDSHTVLMHLQTTEQGSPYREHTIRLHVTPLQCFTHLSLKLINMFPCFDKKVMMLIMSSPWFRYQLFHCFMS